jgi:hypothetical protein
MTEHRALANPSAYLASAQQQHRYSEVLNEDRAFVARGGRLLYAIDSNIVDFLAKPHEESLRRPAGGRERVGLAQIFSDDPEDSVRVVASALAEHLFFNLSGDCPLILPSPFAWEVKLYIENLTAQVGKTLRHGDEKFRKLIKEIENHPASAAVPIEILERAQDFLFVDHKKSLERDRVRDLFQGFRIVNPDVLPHPRIKGLEREIAEILAEPENVSVMVKQSLDARDWLQRFRSDGDTRIQRTERISRSLAQLTRWNTALELLDPSVRIVLLTTDRSIPATAEKHEENFSRKYIRHPRAYLTELQIFQRTLPTDVAPDVIDQIGIETSPQHFLQLWTATPAKEKLDATIIGRLVSSWKKYLEYAKIDYKPCKKAAELFAYKNTDSITTYFNSIASLRISINNAQEERWDKCFRAGTTASTILSIENKINFYARNSPPVVFGTWTKSRDFIQTLLSWHSNEGFEQKAYDAGVRAVNTEDPSGYAYYLAHAVMFASRGEWNLAGTVAARATERLSPDEPIKPGKPNGREASYFEAVCRRHDSKTAYDLEDLGGLLDRAKAIHASEGGDEDHDILSERFDAELIALDLSRLYFGKFLPELSKHGTNLPGYSEIFSRYLALWAKVCSRSQATNSGVTLELAAAIEQLEIRLIINMLGLYLLDKSRVELDIEPIWARASAMKLNVAEAGGGLSYLGRIIIGIASVTQLDRGPERRRRKQTMHEMLDEKTIIQNATLPYDANRFRAYRRYLEEL